MSNNNKSRTCWRCMSAAPLEFLDYCKRCLELNRMDKAESDEEDRIYNLMHDNFTSEQVEVLEWIIERSENYDK